MSQPLDLNAYIRTIPDFPKPGILFRDITPLLADAAAFRRTIERMAEQFSQARIDVIGAAEARGFIFAAPLALALGVGFVPFRKPGKLPYAVHTFRYELEYGNDSLQVHQDGFAQGQRVLLVDDPLATGGAMAACCRLVENSKAIVAGCAFVIELAELGGRKTLTPNSVFSLLQYD